MKTAIKNEESGDSRMEWRYDSKSQTLYIRGKGDMKDYTAKKGGPFAPWKYFPLKSVEISEGVTSVGAFSFYEMDLEFVKLPSTLASIGSFAFANSGLMYIELPQSLRSIGSYAFSNTLIEHLELPEGLIEIDGTSLYNTPLKELVCGYFPNLEGTLSPEVIIHRRDVDWTTI